MKAEILSIGTELLLGQITDTNAAWLAQQLPDFGIDLYYISQVGDNRQRLTETLRRAHDRSDLVICTGGLGPTEDDLTREAISDLLGEPMEVQPDLEKTLRAYFGGRGMEMPERNVKQATLIKSSQAMDNPVGTAPGWWVEHEGRFITCMPGVPHEMKTMWQNQVVPRLRERVTGSFILSRTLKILGKGESAVEEMVQDYIRSTNPTLATYAKNDGIHLRLTSKAPDEATARDLIFELEIRLRERLGTLIYGEDDETLEGVIGEMLKDRSFFLSVMEAGTGGALSSMLNDAPRSPLFFRGGLVSQQPEVLAGWGVDNALMEANSILSPPVAEAMATAARQTLGTEVGLAICAAPRKDTFPDKPAGQIIMAVDLLGTVRSAELNYRSNPSEIKRLGSIFGLNLLRRMLLK
jgi:nicotinamide-nucleotide amidase